MAETKVSEERKTKTHHIAADINNIVIVLLRMEEMQKRLPEIMLQKTDDTVEPGEHDGDGDGEEPLEEDGAGEEEPLEVGEQGYEGTQPETEIEP